MSWVPVTVTFVRAVWDTMVFSIVTVVLELILGMGIALVINGFPARSVAQGGDHGRYAGPLGHSHGRILADVAVDVRPNTYGLFNVVFQMLGIGQWPDPVPYR